MVLKLGVSRVGFVRCLMAQLRPKGVDFRKWSCGWNFKNLGAGKE